MKEIKIGHRKNVKYNLVTLVDNDDYEKYKNINWSLVNKRYAGRQLSRKNGIEKQTKVFLHRLIMGINNDLSVSVDHIDGNGLNNQKANLRKCSHSENMCNRGSCKNSSSKYKGVRWDKERKKWAARIGLRGKGIALGRYENEIDAAVSYNIAAKQYHGEFAKLNIISV